ncbi:DNA polymerase V [Yarrowia sp. B02]|nr:DNA polymerase V [Yarrowia sp. B02]
MASERPDQEYIDTFWKLSSNDPEERVEGCKELISSTDSEVKWNYGIKRLIKGLASPKPSARLGFSTALTEFVSLPYGLTVDGYFDLLNEHLPLASGMKTKEIRNTLLGRLFGVQAISGSQLLRIDDSEGFQRFIDYAVEISVKKAWLRELAFFAIVQFIKREMGSNKKLADKSYIIEKLKDTKLDKTPEAVAIYLTIGGGDWDPLAKNNAVELGKILKDVSSPQDDDNSKQKGNWSPKPNFVWPMILQILSQDEVEEVKETKKSKKDKKKDKKKEAKEEPERITLPVFWNIVVDQSLFAQSASPERKYWGFEILQLALGIVSKDKVGILLSPNLLRTLINQLGSSDRLLNKAAKHVVTKLTELAPTPVGPEIIKALLLNPGGSLNFDRLTKTKTIHTMLANVDMSAVPTIIELLKQVFIAPDEKAGKALDGKRQWALDQMLGLVRRFHVEALANADVDWIDEIIKFMIRWGFFKDNSGKKRKIDESEFVPLSHRTVNDCLGRFNSVLSAVLNTARPDSNTWAYAAWNYLSSMMSERFSRLRIRV